MTGGTEFQEAAEASQEKPEVTEARDQLNTAAYDAPAAVEKTIDYKQADEIQETFVAVVQVTVTTETPPESPDVSETAANQQETRGTDKPTDSVVLIHNSPFLFSYTCLIQS